MGDTQLKPTPYLSRESKTAINKQIPLKTRRTKSQLAGIGTT
uniref:Uncharacterized protein n=1 Tax=Heterorhabditis bacteriophora TaxID=37862 RepID=A0A1I7WVA4_HETBA